jgi:hypothetical protein
MTYGNDANIAMCFQDSYGMLQTDSLYFIPMLSESITPKKPPLISQNMTGQYDEGDHFEGPNTVDGELTAEAQAIPLGVLMKAAFGDPVSVTSDAIYTHTFKPRTADFDEKAANIPFTYYKYLQTGSAELLFDLVGASFEMNVANGELLMAKLGVVGGSRSDIADVAASYPGGKKFAWNVTSASIGGSAIADFKQLTITVNENIAPDHTLNASRTPSVVKRTGFRTTEIGGTIKFNNRDEYQQFLTQSERELIANFKGTTEIQSGYFEEVRIIVPVFRYVDDFPTAAAGPGEIEVSFSAKGLYSPGSGTATEFVVVNTQAAY